MIMQYSPVVTQEKGRTQIDYHFVMHHTGKVVQRQRLERYAQDFNGQITAYQDHDTRTCLQAILGSWLPLDFPQHNIIGAMATARFNSMENKKLFQDKLKTKGIKILDEAVWEIPA